MWAPLAKLRDELMVGRATAMGRPIYRSTIASQLAAQRVRDGIGARRVDQTGLDRLTICIKTFERPRFARRLVASIRRFYPDVRIVVADDSATPGTLDGAEVLALPFNVGVSAGRNAALAEVDTPYVLFCDDDFVFCGQTRLAPVLAAMDATPEIDLMGGLVLDLPWRRSADYRTKVLFPLHAPPVHPYRSRLDGYEVMGMVANFFVARTDRLRRVQWDPQLKIMEHTDFFTRAQGILTTVFNPDYAVLHAQDRFDTDYVAHRKNHQPAQIVIANRYFNPDHTPASGPVPEVADTRTGGEPR